MRLPKTARLGMLLMLGALASAAPAQTPPSTPATPAAPPTAAELGFDKLLFVKRFQYTSNHYYTNYINSAFNPGGNLCILDLKTGQVTPVVKGLEGGVFGRFDLSFDGQKVLFAWKKAQMDGYRIYECRIDGSNLRQLTFPQPDEQELIRKYRVGYHHGTDDMDPCYLPDGGICFISTRCQFGILCDAPDDFTTTVLYRMDADGKNMEKLTNSSVSEAAPSVMNDGRILYTRWEYVDKGAVSVKCLWAMRPDGSLSSEVYGNDIALPPTFTQGRAIPGSSNLFVAMGTPHFAQTDVGTVLRIDTAKNIRTREPMTYLTPDVDIRGEGGFAFRAPDGRWHNDGSGRSGMLFKDPYPLSAERFLVAGKPAGTTSADLKGWGLYLLEGEGKLRPIYCDPEISSFMPMPLRARPVPPVVTSSRDPKLAEQKLAVCVIQDVYQGLKNVQRGEAKYLRIVEQVPRPWAARRYWPGDEYDQQHAVVSKDAALGLKVQHGIVPIESDGSAHFTVPADRNIYFQLLDANYMELQRERTYINYRPGEKRTCVGCHESTISAPPSAPNTLLALRRAPSVPGPQLGEKSGARPLHYITDVQPVWDKHCVSCHNTEHPQGHLDLSGTLTAQFCVSYENLMPERRKNPRRDPDLLGPIIGENHPKTGNVDYLPAKSLGSHASVLVSLLSQGKVQLADPARAARVARLLPAHKDVKLSPEELIRVSTWVESNGQYYGAYWGRRNLQYKDRSDFRPVPTFEEATSMTPPREPVAGK